MSSRDRIGNYWKICGDLILRLSDESLTENEFNEIAIFVATMKESLFYDFQIVCSDIIIPCHKYVLSFRSEILRMKFSEDIKELNWTEFGADVTLALLRWFYIDKLSSLFEASERWLLLTVNENTYFEFYNVAKEVGAKLLAEKCSQFKNILCNNLPTELDESKKNPSCSSYYLEKMDTGVRLIDGVNTQNDFAASRAVLWQIVNGITIYLTFSDTLAYMNSKCILPAHLHVFKRRSEIVYKEFVVNLINIPRTEFRHSLLRWIYTDKFVWESDDVTMELLCASRNYQLPALFEMCEEALARSVNIKSCAKFLHFAKTTNTTKILQRCSDLLNVYWKGLHSHDVDELLKMIVNKPLPCMQPMTHMEYKLSETPIMIMNDDCFFAIFHWISVTDLSSIKQTCRKFNEVAYLYFRIYGNKFLSINSSCLFGDICNLHHFGKLISALHIDDSQFSWSFDNILKIVGKFCTRKLERLSISINSVVENRSIVNIKEILKNVGILEFVTSSADLDLNSFLRHCKHLKEVHLQSTNIELNTSWLKNNRHIKRMTIGRLANDELLQMICKKCKNLKFMSLWCASFSIMRDTTHLNRLNHLKELEIASECPNLPIVLNLLAEKNILECLSLMYAIDERTALTLGGFTKLREFNLSNVEDISRNVVAILARNLINIEKMSFDDCDSITVEEITRIFENQLSLKSLIITDCHEIFIFDKINYMKLRKRRDLTIFLDAQELQNTLELLENHLSDFVKFSAIPNNWSRWKP